MAGCRCVGLRDHARDLRYCFGHRLYGCGADQSFRPDHAGRLESRSRLRASPRGLTGGLGRSCDPGSAQRLLGLIVDRSLAALSGLPSTTTSCALVSASSRPTSPSPSPPRPLLPRAHAIERRLKHPVRAERPGDRRPPKEAIPLERAASGPGPGADRDPAMPGSALCTLVGSPYPNTCAPAAEQGSGTGILAGRRVFGAHRSAPSQRCSLSLRSCASRLLLGARTRQQPP